MNLDLYSFLFEHYDAAFIQGVAQMIARGLQIVAGVMQIIMAFFVARYAGAVLLGKASFHDVGIYIFRALAVATILVPEHFNAWVRDTFLKDLPAFLARISGNGSADPEHLARTFDDLHNATVKMVMAIKMQTTGIYYLSTRFEIATASLIIFAAISIGFLMWFAARLVTALVLPVGPFVLPGYLFDATRGFADRWTGKLVGLALLSLLVLVMIGIVTAQDIAYLHTLQTAGNDVEVMVQMVWNFALVTVIGAMLMVILPGVASYIGGSVGFSGSGMIMAFRTGWTMARGSQRKAA